MDSDLSTYLTALHAIMLFPFKLRANGARIGDRQPQIRFHVEPVPYYIKSFVLVSLVVYCQSAICTEKMSSRGRTLNEIIFVGCTLLLEVPHLHATFYAMSQRDELMAIARELHAIGQIVGKLKTGRMRSTRAIRWQVLALALAVVYLQTVYVVHYDFRTFLMYHVGYTLPKLSIVLATLTFVNLLLQINGHFATINGAIDGTIVAAGSGNVVHAYFRLTHLANRLDRFYGWQNLLHVAHYFCWIFYELYHWTILVFLEEITADQRYLLVYATSWISVQSIALTHILYACHVTARNGNATVALWNDFASRTAPTKFAIGVSLRFLNRRVCFTANNWFRIDLALILSILGTFLTYAIIFMEFSSDA